MPHQEQNNAFEDVRELLTTEGVAGIADAQTRDSGFIRQTMMTCWWAGGCAGWTTVRLRLFRRPL